MLFTAAFNEFLRFNALRPEEECMFKPRQLEHNADRFPVNHSFWQALTMAAAIEEEQPDEVQMLFVLGEHEGKLYATTALTAIPEVWELEAQVCEPTRLNAAHMGRARPGSLTPFTTSATYKQGTKVIPLDPEDINHLFTYAVEGDANALPGQHPSVLQRATGNRTILFDRWLRAACLHQEGNEGHSNVAIPIRQVREEEVPMPVIEQLLQDLLELQEEMPEAAAELTVHLRPLLSRLPSRQEEEEQEVRYVGRRRVSFGAGDEEEGDAQPEPEQGRRSERRTQRGLAPRETAQEEPNFRARQAGTRENREPMFREAFGDRTFEEVPTGREVPFSPNNTERVSFAPLPFSPYARADHGQSYSTHGNGGSRYDELMNLLEMGVQLTDEEKFALQFLERRQSRKASSSASNVVAIAMPSILAWAGVRRGQERHFHSDLRHIWKKLEGETKSNSKVIIKQDFEHVMRGNKAFRLCSQDALADTLVGVQFKPGDLRSTKPHLGLTPLMFIARQSQELLDVQEQGELNQRSNFNTPQDILKTRLGAPKLPQTVDESINAIHRCELFTSCYLGPRCPYVILCGQVIEALNEHYTEYNDLGRNFGAVIGNEILYQLSNIADKFYGTMASQVDFERGILPTIEASWLISAIRTGQLQNSRIRPALFGALKPTEPKPEPKPQTKETTGRKRDRKPKTDKVKAERVLPAELLKHIQEYAGKGKGNLNMRVVREANSITSAQELAKQLGLDVKTDCLQYHCLGSCPGCSLEHKVNPAFKKDKAAELLEKAANL